MQPVRVVDNVIAVFFWIEGCDFSLVCHLVFDVVFSDQPAITGTVVHSDVRIFVCTVDVGTVRTNFVSIGIKVVVDIYAFISLILDLVCIDVVCTMTVFFVGVDVVFIIAGMARKLLWCGQYRHYH